ncbi:MAG: hypothetical protein NXY57DRAFT_1074211, partial [Lentinula lateritia]
CPLRLQKFPLLLVPLGRPCLARPPGGRLNKINWHSRSSRPRSVDSNYSKMSSTLESHWWPTVGMTPSGLPWRLWPCPAPIAPSILKLARFLKVPLGVRSAPVKRLFPGLSAWLSHLCQRLVLVTDVTRRHTQENLKQRGDKENKQSSGLNQ